MADDESHKGSAVAAIMLPTSKPGHKCTAFATETYVELFFQGG